MLNNCRYDPFTRMWKNVQPFHENILYSWFIPEPHKGHLRIVFFCFSNLAEVLMLTVQK